MTLKVNRIDWKALLTPSVDPVTGVVEYSPLLCIDPEPEPTPSPAPEQPTPTPTPEPIQNPEGLVGALNKYKRFGSVNEVEAMATAARKYAALEAQIKTSGHNLGELPTILSSIEQADQQRQAAEQQRELIKAEYERQLAEQQLETKKAQNALLSNQRAATLQPAFNHYARQEALSEYGTYYSQLANHVVFKDGTAEVEKILGPDGQQLWDKEGDEVKPAGLDYFFNQVMDGKYGFALKSALKSRTEASGGGSFSSRTVNGNSVLQINQDAMQDPTFLSNLTPEQQRQIKRGDYQIVG